LNPNLLARSQILAGACLFSTGGAAMKWSAFDAWQINALRCLIAAAVLAACAPAVWRNLHWRLVPVALAYAGTMTFFVLATKNTTAANAIFLQSAAPLYVLCLAPFWLGERATRRDLWFMAAVAAGVVLLFLAPQANIASAPRPALGNVFGACAGVCYACTLIGMRWLALRHPGDTGAAIASVAAGNLLAGVACMAWALPIAAGTPADWLVVIYLGVFQVAAAYLLVTRGLSRLPALEASLLLLIEPVLNPVWVWWLVGERPAALALCGGAVILGSIALRTWQQSAIDRDGRDARQPAV
jgi:drug/metabolite transporter (DMT)-like permease